jgi:hypothetical protein
VYVEEGCLEHTNPPGGRSAKEIEEVCQRFKAHDKEIRETTALVDAAWIKIELQMRFLSRISRLLEEELAQSQLNLLHILKGKLRQAVAQLVVEKSGYDINDRSPKQMIVDYLKRCKWAIKDGLKELVAELETWQNRFDPTWYLMILNNNTILDNEIRIANGELAEESDARSNLLKNQQNPLANMWKL